MITSSLAVLSGSVETAVCKSSTTSNRFWLMCGGMSLIPVVGASGMETGAAAAGTRFCL
jgi:hypothetical protein